VDRLRSLGHVGGVPVPLAAPGEEPLPVDLAVLVVVPDRHHDPAVADLVLGAAVDLPVGTVRPQQLDTMTDDLVDRPVKPPQLRDDEPAQGFTPPAARPELDVRDE